MRVLKHEVDASVNRSTLTITGSVVEILALHSGLTDGTNDALKAAEATRASEDAKRKAAYDAGYVAGLADVRREEGERYREKTAGRKGLW